MFAQLKELEQATVKVVQAQVQLKNYIFEADVITLQSKVRLTDQESNQKIKIRSQIKILYNQFKSWINKSEVRSKNG